MTREELAKVPFECQGHMSLAHEHTMMYSSKDGRLGFCDHTPKRKNGDFGRTYRHWRIDNKVYKTEAKFYEALKNFDYDERGSD